MGRTQEEPLKMVSFRVFAADLAAIKRLAEQEAVDWSVKARRLLRLGLRTATRPGVVK